MALFREGVILMCAWVLWSQTLQTATQRVAWSVPQAFNSKEICDERLAVTLDGLKASGWTTVGNKGAGSAIAPKSGNLMNLVCLPDTVDPRQPKQ
ncbi:MAG: hypothetical protein HY725_14280 [Candidatus Rokubacteria bacterium]|nr:hypothetical protein [Candidatus Rokubacteria bacterium]